MHLKNNRWIFLLTLLLIISFSQFAESQTCGDAGFMGRFQQFSNVTLLQTCPTCTFINITVTDPNSTVSFSDVVMTESNDIFTFGPNSTISSTLGVYFVQGVSNLDDPFKSCYVITNIEREISTPESIIYLILTSVVFP